MRTYLLASALAFFASAGCTFASPPEGGDDLGGADDEPTPTTQPGQQPGPPPAARGACDSADASLRLCVDFTGAVTDRSASGAPIAATSVGTMDRDGDPAASLSMASTMHVHEAAALDIQGGLALDMWIRPTGKPATGARYWMLDNNQQYGASYTDAGTIRCVLASYTVDSAVLPLDGKFHHVACTYDQTKLKVFVDGDVARCQDLTVAIPTTGTDGLAIGANLSGTDASPTFYDGFIGGLDDVRVWARADLDVCAAAGRTGCRTSCDGL